MVRVSSPAKLRPWSELIAKMEMGVVPGLVNYDGELPPKKRDWATWRGKEAKAQGFHSCYKTPDPRRVSEGFLKRSREGPLKGF